MPKSKLANKKTAASTQQYLDIAEIKDDLVVLKDGTMRAVMLASSINFALKSEDEQNAIIAGYISFLNSLDFSVQIVIQSRRLNIDGYLENLLVKQREQTNELLRTQIAEYREFISQLITLGEIMGKRFYVVVPYTPEGKGRAGFFSQLGAVFSPAKVIRLSDATFRKYQERLLARVEKVTSNLSSLGITAVQLNTQSLIELYYNCYNVDLAYNQKLPPTEKLSVEET
ncbi:MAG: hypothetical protein A3H70_03260 [Candidatus Komeilibacteria bacterium RIFCSPLOWO2_02_FULL_48_11]|uniref:TraC-like domain-containing protein n=1 Tax=Candidatus Komeilibacteria bacterium RIFCSPLOWO2_02_FULL_48_11 TaxID=1798553 RepID=A0A1G2BTN2_9BACT|nr:MAG: hypothetical protein A3H70_03260 [Candidatus Komeilibacteria bacterium RIFCSPLOWO2_02_FULL_48_11]